MPPPNMSSSERGKEEEERGKGPIPYWEKGDEEGDGKVWERENRAREKDGGRRGRMKRERDTIST